MRTEIERFLRSIWPTVYKIVDGTVYFILNLAKSTITMMIEEIKSSG